MSRPVIQIADMELEPWEQGTFYGGADFAAFAPKIGLTQLGIGYSEVPPGKSGCPFHNHHVEDEMFVILEGEGTYRFGKESHPFHAGAVLGAPAGGPDTAHQIINTGSVPLKYFAISTKAKTDVCEYPDSGKFLVTSERADTKTRLRQIGREGEHNLDYWDGEPGA